jgi:hypothetical protein
VAVTEARSDRRRSTCRPSPRSRASRRGGRSGRRRRIGGRVGTVPVEQHGGRKGKSGNGIREIAAVTDWLC